MQKARLNLNSFILFVASVAVILSPSYVSAQQNSFHPYCALRQAYDDNIFFSDEDKQADWITTLSPGFTIEPHLKKHKLTFGYHADLHFFANHDAQNSYNHTVDTGLELNSNKVRLNLINMFYYFSDRSGLEDVNRIPRTQDQLQSILTFAFNRLDLSLQHIYRLEDYRSDDAIGSFFGRPLTYEDLQRDEHELGLEAALKLWSKTALLLSLDYGMIEHDTGQKSDSNYFAFLVGLRGEPWSRAVLEAKIGFRSQDYDDFDDDFTSVVFTGSLLHHFNARNRLHINLLRTTEETIYADNAYYESTSAELRLEHDFTERILGSIDCLYVRHDYPYETSEAGQTAKRQDDYWLAGVGLSYKLPKWFTADLRYQHTFRDSNFAIYDYQSNVVSVGLHGEF